MREWIYDKSSYIFFLTLIIYIITLCTVTYVGVYLTYVAVPVIIVSGFIMYCSKPKNNENA